MVANIAGSEALATAGPAAAVPPLTDTPTLSIPRALQVPRRPEILAPLVLGLFAASLFVAVMSVWSYLAPLASAAIAAGQVVTDGSRRTVQHLEGGIIREILVKDGDKVRSGQVMVRLDDIQSGASTDLLRAQWDVLRAQNTRLGAEIADETALAFPTDLLARKSEPRVAEIIASQTGLFEARQRAHQGIVAVLRQRAEQLRSEIASYEGLLRSVQEQLVSINGEMKDVQELVDKGYERRPRLLTLQRQASGLTGTKDQHLAMIAKARQAITETELQIAQQTNTRRNEVATDRRDTQAQMADVEEKLRSAQDVRARREVTAPTDGLVTNLRFHTLGGVVKPGDPLLDIIADNEALMVEVRISPTDIDTVETGQQAEVRLTAFKQRTMPALKGKLIYVAADVEADAKTGASFYRGRVQIDMLQLAQIPNARLTAGMPAEVMVLAGERTLLQYLLQPLIDSFRRAFREQ
ncbi:MAG: HlyD family type I secretion periplasmic adaptor subunit [Alphaproteobacteria bacterium]|nr:HlyD family type I secretion periplasmic adaptor subunit [Alphaproteobacteria bacterium]